MADRISILTTAYTFSEYSDECAEFAVLFLSREDIPELKRLALLLKENKLVQATSWEMGDASFFISPVKGCDLHASDKVGADDLEDFNGEICDEDDYMRTEGAQLHIRAQGDVYFSDFLKHSDIKIESEAISIEDLETCLDMKIEDAPKFLESDKTFIREHAKQLLAKGE